MKVSCNINTTSSLKNMLIFRQAARFESLDEFFKKNLDVKIPFQGPFSCP